MFNQLLDKSQKNNIMKIISKYDFNENQFYWSTRRSLFKLRSILIYKPYGYYFVFEKKRNIIFVKEFFPNWAKDYNQSVSDNIENSITDWIKSILRINERKKDLITSIDRGATKRKNFNDYSKNIIDK
ncbi:MAG: hypothetical protein CMG74_10415 [Candidatus Marinimicrobia bacterium]|nr:hypothetical protein [Candidatus Neomarinimicrobiota bacterium]|tara:strand:- start:8753 stop:9136 length:384 start_codon:yes stop_codon:yes gene_type:complete